MVLQLTILLTAGVYIIRQNPEIVNERGKFKIEKKWDRLVMWLYTTKKQAAIIAIPFFAISLGSVIGSNLKVKQRNDGQLSLTAAFANAFALIFSFWFLDLTIPDWLMFVRHTPDWVVLPGTEGMAGYDDYLFHLKEHTKALPMLAGSALVFALLTASRPWQITS